MKKFIITLLLGIASMQAISQVTQVLFIGNSYTGNAAPQNGLIVEGGVGIGTSVIPVNYKLIVEGQIGAREVIIVKPNDPWPDYIFENNHKLMPFDELNKFIKTKKHLPGIPSKLTIEKEGGFRLGETQIKQLASLEELYLYVMLLESRIKTLENENAGLERK